MKNLAMLTVGILIGTLIYCQQAALRDADAALANRDLTIAALKIIATGAGEKVDALNLQVSACKQDTQALSAIGQWLSTELRTQAAELRNAKALAATCKST